MTTSIKSIEGMVLGQDEILAVLLSWAFIINPQVLVLLPEEDKRIILEFLKDIRETKEIELKCASPESVIHNIARIIQERRAK